MTQPEPIRNFSRAFLASVAVGILNIVLNYGYFVQTMEADPAVAESGLGGTFLIGTYAIGVAISLLLWYFVARRGSVVAKWILVLFFVLGLLMLPGSIIGAPLLLIIGTIVATVLQALSIWFLFRPESKSWFANDGDAPTV